MGLEQYTDEVGRASADYSALTPDEVQRFAFESGCAILHACITAHRHGACTWAQAMQVAALNLVRENIRLRGELIKMAERATHTLIVKQ